MKELEKQLKALANKRRLAILKILKRNKVGVSVGQLAKEIKLSFRSTSRHLAILLSQDIVGKDQQGLNMYYTLSPSLQPAVRKILEML